MFLDTMLREGNRIGRAISTAEAGAPAKENELKMAVPLIRNDRLS